MGDDINFPTFVYTEVVGELFHLTGSLQDLYDMKLEDWEMGPCLHAGIDMYQVNFKLGERIFEGLSAGGPLEARKVACDKTYHYLICAGDKRLSKLKFFRKLQELKPTRLDYFHNVIRRLYSFRKKPACTRAPPSLGSAGTGGQRDIHYAKLIINNYEFVGEGEKFEEARQDLCKRILEVQMGVVPHAPPPPELSGLNIQSRADGVSPMTTRAPVTAPGPNSVTTQALVTAPLLGADGVAPMSTRAPVTAQMQGRYQITIPVATRAPVIVPGHNSVTTQALVTAPQLGADGVASMITRAPVTAPGPNSVTTQPLITASTLGADGVAPISTRVTLPMNGRHPIVAPMTTRVSVTAAVRQGTDRTGRFSPLNTGVRNNQENFAPRPAHRPRTGRCWKYARTGFCTREYCPFNHY